MRTLLIASLLCLSVSLSAQIAVNTNFEIISNQPIDTRDTLTTLADTAFVDWTFAGLLTYATDVDQYWYYNGSFWRRIGALIEGGQAITMSGDTVHLGGVFDNEILINSLTSDSFNITTDGFVELDVNGLRVHDGASTGSIFFDPNSTINTKITTSGGLNLHTTGGGRAKINFYRGATEFGNMNEDDGLRINRITSYSTTGPPELYLYGWNTISGPGGRVTLHGGSGSASNANAGNVSLVGGHVDTLFQVDYSGVPGAVVIWSYSDTTVSGVVPALYTSAIFPGGVYAGKVSLSGSHNPTSDVDIDGKVRIRNLPDSTFQYLVVADANGRLARIDTTGFGGGGAADGNGLFDAANDGDTTAIAEMYLGGPLTIYGLNNVLTIDSLSEAVIAIDNALDTRSVLAMSEIETRISFVNTDVSMNSHLLLNSTQNSLYFNDSSDSTNTEISNDANSVTLYAQSVPDSILSSTNLTPSYMQMYATSPTSTGMTYISPGLHRSYQTTGNDISRVELFNNYITYLILDSGVDTMNVYFTPTGLGIKDVTPTSTLDINGTLAVQEVTQNDTLTKIAALDYSSGRLHWVDASTLGGSGGGLEGAGTAHQVAVWIEPDSLHSYSSFTYNGTNLIGSVPGYVLFNGDVQASIYSDSGNVILTSHVQEAGMESSIEIANNFIVFDADTIQIFGALDIAPDSILGIAGTLMTRTAIADLAVNSIYNLLPNQTVTIDPNNFDLQIGTNALNNSGEFEFWTLTADTQDAILFAGSRDSSGLVGSGDSFAADVLMGSFGAEDGIAMINYDFLGTVYNFAVFGDSMFIGDYPGSSLNLFIDDLPRAPADTLSLVMVQNWTTKQVYGRNASTIGMQTLSASNDTLTISGGNSLKLPITELTIDSITGATITINLETRYQKIVQLDMTSATSVTLTVNNPMNAGVYTFHFLGVSGTDNVTWPASFYDANNVALGTDALTAGVMYTCYYSSSDAKYFCK